MGMWGVVSDGQTRLFFGRVDGFGKCCIYVSFEGDTLVQVLKYSLGRFIDTFNVFIEIV